jgi:Leucine-rich repeat (LRR) protein
LELSSIPACVSGLAGLRELDLHGCGITSLPANALSSLTGLTALWLHDNRIQRISPGAFQGLSSLMSLDLHGNRLKQLPSSMFGDVPSLRRLDISSNQLQAIPFTISDAPHLARLNVSRNQLDTVPMTIRQLTSLQLLKVARNPFVESPHEPITDGHVCRFPSLRQLAANQCLRSNATMGAILLEDALPDDAKEWLVSQSYGLCGNCSEFSLVVCSCLVESEHVLYERLPLRTNHCSRKCSKEHSDTLAILRQENAARLRRRVEKFSRPPLTSGVISTCGFHS